MRNLVIYTSLVFASYLSTIIFDELLAQATGESALIGKDAVSELTTLLDHLERNTDQALLKNHFASISTIINDHTHDIPWTAQDSLWAAGALLFFQHEGAAWDTYLNGPRPLIINFRSPSDGKNTYYWLILPNDYQQDNNGSSLYVELHGSGGGKNNNPRNMLFRALQPELKGVTSQGYRKEGFYIYPWGRGDKWYLGQSEKDIFECLAHFDSMFKTDKNNQFLYGFSMGGAGTYTIAQKSMDRWTAIGIYSGAFRNGVTLEDAVKFKSTPVWMAWGENEGLAEVNRKLRDYFIESGIEVKWTEVPDVAHSYLGEYQKDLMDWFIKHIK